MNGNLIRHNSTIRLAAFAVFAIGVIQSTVRAHPTASHTGAVQDTHVDLYRNIWINPGLARGQTLRYTWTNMNDPNPRNRILEPSSIRVKLIDSDGSVIAQTDAAAVGPNQFQFFDFNRNE